jgi:hypothetical protein
MLWLTLLWSALITTFFAAGLCAGSILSNRRFAEKCARCQTIVNRSHVFCPTVLPRSHK